MRTSTSQDSCFYDMLFVVRLMSGDVIDTTWFYQYRWRNSHCTIDRHPAGQRRAPAVQTNQGDNSRDMRITIAARSIFSLFAGCNQPLTRILWTGYTTTLWRLSRDRHNSFIVSFSHQKVCSSFLSSIIATVWFILLDYHLSDHQQGAYSLFGGRQSR